MPQTAPEIHGTLADLFQRRGIDGHDFFEQPEHIIENLISTGNDALETDDFQIAEVAYFDALKLAQASKFHRLEASVSNDISGILDIQGRQLEALSFLESALQIYKRLEDKRGQSVCLCNIGGLKATLGQFNAAFECLKEALIISKFINDSRLTVNILVNIGLNCFSAGLHSNSIMYYKEAGELSLKNGFYDTYVNCLVNEGDTLINLERLDDALIVLRNALAASKLHGITSMQIESLDNLGAYHERVGDWIEAVSHHQQAYELAQSIEYAEGQLNAVLNLGRVNVDHGDPAQAAEQLHEALSLAVKLDRPKSRRDAHQHLSRLYKQQGQPALALEHFEAFHAEERELLSTERDKTTRTLMMQFDVERAQTQTRAEREQREHAEVLQAQAEAQVHQRTAELEQTQMEVVSRLAMAAEFRDDATGEHTRRVGIASALIAESLGLSRHFIDTLRVAARLHDVGKIGIPDAVLLKAGKLSVPEFEEMKRHTLIGARLLSGGQSEVLNMARQIALTHHERWDGNGYPNGLTGPEIPLVGRIVALADVFDALMHRRPYKSAWEKAEALAELARQRGRHFDPELVGAALLVFGGGRYEAALLEGVQEPSVPAARPATELTQWEVETLRLQYEQVLEHRTRELEAARYHAGVQVELLRREALTDPLTGLHNRRAFEADLQLFTEQVGAGQDGPGGGASPSDAQQSLCVISLDLDGLKSVNDTGGHASGDALICLVARQLQQHFEPGGRVYRMGGDEYTVLLWSEPDTLERELAGELASLETELRRQGHLASFSAGYAHWPQDANSPEELLPLSDERMYQQKRQRKQRLPDRPAPDRPAIKLSS
jgi:diguanylate cyclase (GGDEF)-like protein